MCPSWSVSDNNYSLVKFHQAFLSVCLCDLTSSLPKVILVINIVISPSIEARLLWELHHE